MHSTGRVLLASALASLVLTACYRPGSRTEEPEPASAPMGAESAEGTNGFFDCPTLEACVDLCDVDEWTGCMGAYTRSDTSTPELEAKAKPYLEKACKLGGGLPCTMLETSEPAPAASDDPLVNASSAPSAKPR